MVEIISKDIAINAKEPKKILCDNKTAISLTTNLVFDQIKHIEIDHDFNRERIDSRDMVLSHVKSVDQVAYVFT